MPGVGVGVGVSEFVGVEEWVGVAVFFSFGVEVAVALRPFVGVGVDSCVANWPLACPVNSISPTINTKMRRTRMASTLAPNQRCKPCSPATFSMAIDCLYDKLHSGLCQ